MVMTVVFLALVLDGKMGMVGLEKTFVFSNFAVEIFSKMLCDYF